MADRPNYIVQPLGDQNRAAFQCGIEELDRYFHERASRDAREKLAAVFVLVTDKDPNDILGFYTLSPVEIDAGELPESLRKRTGRYQRVGATLIGRLAVDQRHHREGWGGYLLVDALKRVLDNVTTISSWAVVVDAKDSEAIGFYTHYGFISLKNNRLFLPMKTIEKLFPASEAQPATLGSST